MFDRGSRESSQGPTTVQITLDGGEEMQGRLVLPPGRTMSDVLNSTAPFIEFEPADGERMYIAKTALQSVKPLNVPARPDLWAGSAEAGNFDPHVVLGLKPGATREEARDAYVRLAKTYPPTATSRSTCRARCATTWRRWCGGSMPPTRCSRTRRGSRPPSRRRCTRAMDPREPRCDLRARPCGRPGLDQLST